MDVWMDRSLLNLMIIILTVVVFFIVAVCWQVLIELARYGEKPVGELEAIRLANRLGARTYVESSALTQRNLKEVFDEAIVAAMSNNDELRRLTSTGRGSTRSQRLLNSLHNWRVSQTSGSTDGGGGGGLLHKLHRSSTRRSDKSSTKMVNTSSSSSSSSNSNTSTIQARKHPPTLPASPPMATSTPKSGRPRRSFWKRLCCCCSCCC